MTTTEPTQDVDVRPLPRGARPLPGVPSGNRLGPRPGRAASAPPIASSRIVSASTAGALTDPTVPPAGGAAPRRATISGAQLESLPIAPAASGPVTQGAPAAPAASPSRPPVGRGRPRSDAVTSRPTVTQPLAAISGGPAPAGPSDADVAAAAARASTALHAERAAAAQVPGDAPTRARSGAVSAPPGVARPEFEKLEAAVAALEAAVEEREEADRQLRDLLEQRAAAPVADGRRRAATAGAVPLALAGAKGGSTEQAEATVRANLVASGAARDDVRAAQARIGGHRAAGAPGSPGAGGAPGAPGATGPSGLPGPAGLADVGSQPVVAVPPSGFDRPRSASAPPRPAPSAGAAPGGSGAAPGGSGDADGATGAPAGRGRSQSAPPPRTASPSSPAPPAVADVDTAPVDEDLAKAQAAMTQAQTDLEKAQAASRAADDELAKSYAALMHSARAERPGAGNIPRAIAGAQSVAVVGMAAQPVAGAPPVASGGRARSGAVTEQTVTADVARAGQTHLQKQRAASLKRHEARGATVKATGAQEALEVETRAAAQRTHTAARASSGRQSSGAAASGSAAVAGAAGPGQTIQPLQTSGVAQAGPEEPSPVAAMPDLIKKIKGKGSRSDAKQQMLRQELFSLVEKVDKSVAKKVESSKANKEGEPDALVAAAEQLVKDHERRKPGASESRKPLAEKEIRRKLTKTTAASAAAASSVVAAQEALEQARTAPPVLGGAAGVAAGESAAGGPAPASGGPKQKKAGWRLLSGLGKKRQTTGGSGNAAAAATAAAVATAGQSLVQKQMAAARAKHAQRAAQAEAKEAGIELTDDGRQAWVAASPAAVGTPPATPSGVAALAGATESIRSQSVAGPTRLVQQPQGGAPAPAKPVSGGGAGGAKGGGVAAALGGAAGAAAGVSAAALANKLLKRGKGKPGAADDDLDEDLIVRRVTKEITQTTSAPQAGSHRTAAKERAATPTVTDRMDFTDEIVRSVELRVLEELDRRGLLNRRDLW